MKQLFFTLTLLLIVTCNVRADTSLFDIGHPDDWTYSVAYNVFTTHHNSDGYIDDDTGLEVPYNEDNRFVGVRVNFTDRLGAFVMTGESSYYSRSYGAGIELSTPNRYIEVGADMGLVSGYEQIISGGVLPFVNPFIRGNSYLGANQKISTKLGAMNFMAFNVFVEYTQRF